MTLHGMRSHPSETILVEKFKDIELQPGRDRIVREWNSGFTSSADSRPGFS